MITNKKRSRLKPSPPNSSAAIWGRLMFVWGVLMIGAIALAVRLYVLQITEPVPVAKQSPLLLEPEKKLLREIAGKNLQQIAENQQTTYLKLYTPRRQIVDNQQNVLATDVITYRLYIHPHLFSRNHQQVSQQEVAASLANILETRTKEEFLAYFADPTKKGIPLSETISESTVKKIQALRIDGLDLRKHYSRVYPHKEMVAEVIGYINEDLQREPQAGVEYTQNNLLARQPVKLKSKRSYINVEGQNQAIYFPGYFDRSQQVTSFDDLRLQVTINLRLQEAARAALKSSMDNYQAKRGTVIVMDVADGSILAMVCSPTYDPNQYQKYSDYSLFKNWAITDLYEPGSTFKPINVAIALDEGVVQPEAKFDDTGEIKIGTDIVRNHDYETVKPRGELTIPEILQHSSNVGMIKLMANLAPKKYYQRLKKLGVEDKIELEIPWSTPGTLKDEIEFTVRDIEPATAAFGQGFSLTPLKLIQLHAAIANGGKLVTPHVVRGLSDFEGYLHYSIPKQATTVFAPETTRTVLKMMEKVVQDGSGAKAKIPYYRVAGKTGTSQKSDSVTGSYAENAKITSFVGIFPVEKPRYAVLAVVDEPKGSLTFGSNVAAPVVGEVMKAIIAHEGIEPTSVKYQPQIKD
jgi:cell division protein FtsI (penicillin-binding protein 3)